VLDSKLFTAVRPLGLAGIVRGRAVAGIGIAVTRAVAVEAVVGTTVDITIIVDTTAGGGVCVGSGVAHAASRLSTIVEIVNRQIVFIATRLYH
jgi:choline-glycine betaine transporter